jgi:hypothetical protein
MTVVVAVASTNSPDFAVIDFTHPPPPAPLWWVPSRAATWWTASGRSLPSATAPRRLDRLANDLGVS